jgi:hypothetical protein
VAVRRTDLSPSSTYETTYRPAEPGNYRIVASIARDADHVGDTISRTLSVTKG